MPPKKRTKNSSKAKKAKKQKIVDKEPSVVDSGFQNPNIGVARRILDHLKLVTNDLKALSQTCSSWHVKITTYYREMLAHILPYSYQELTGGEKLELMEEVARVRKHIGDIQMFDFNHWKFGWAPVKSAPWCPNIAFIIEFGHTIIDLRKPDPIIEEELDVEQTQFSCNTLRKQVLISHTISKPATSDEPNQILYLYDVGDNGKVDLVRKISGNTKGRTYDALLQDDGTIWLVSFGKVEIFKGESVKQYDYPNILEPEYYFMGFIEHHGVVKLIIQDRSAKHHPVTYIHNTQTRQHEKLPVICHHQNKYDITYTSDSLQFYDTRHRNFSGACTLDPTIQRQIKVDEWYCNYITMSNDGSRMIEYNPQISEKILKVKLKNKSTTRSGKDQDYDTIYKTTIDFTKELKPGEQKKEKKKPRVASRWSKSKGLYKVREFFWITNDLIVAMYKSRLAILDFRSAPPTEGFKSFELPFNTNTLSTDIITRFSDNSFVVWLETSLKSNAWGYKITVPHNIEYPSDHHLDYYSLTQSDDSSE